jgi:hypothetical protein
VIVVVVVGGAGVVVVDAEHKPSSTTVKVRVASVIRFALSTHIYLIV